MTGGAGTVRGMAPIAFVMGLVVSAAVVATMTTGSGRVIALAALMLAALAGQSLQDWREALAIGLGVSALVAWCTSDTGQILAPAFSTVCIVVNTSLAAWYRTGTVAPAALAMMPAVAVQTLALPAPRTIITTLNGGRYTCDARYTTYPGLREIEVAWVPVTYEEHRPSRVA